MSPNARVFHRHLFVDDASEAGRAVVHCNRQAADARDERARHQRGSRRTSTIRRRCSVLRRATAFQSTRRSSSRRISIRQRSIPWCSDDLRWSRVSQGVYNQFGTSGWDQWLAQNGYIVVNINNRGTNNYGRDFMKVVYKQLGTYEAKDFAETARYLRTQPYVDPDRIAIMGTSYGGYSALISMELAPDVFSVGMANSGVADWRLY